MARASQDRTLSLARVVLKVLLVLNLICLAMVALVLAGSFVAETQVLEAMERHPRSNDPQTLMAALRIVMIIGLVAVPLAHVILSRLLAMVDTVRSGDPFVSDNARRLTIIAWALLGLQILDLGLGAVSIGMVSDLREFEWSFGLTGWIAVVMLFVLARVFHHGARMREELEGTV
jgi:uncharacterized protein YneF (UPF0154 family)